MSTFDSELHECLELILGEPVPTPGTGDDPLRVYRQWLAERNLGLVPVADAGEFDWAGTWLARVRAANGAHAVVMFGSPSGPLHDPSRALADGGTIEQGWVLSRLDLRLPIDEPYGATRSVGTVAGVLVAAAAEAPLVRVESIDAVAGRGLVGDRYHDSRGTFSGPGRGYELTLVEAEVLDSIELPWEQARRNIVTRGIELNALAGRPFTVGPVECIGRRLAEPCAHLERLTRPGLLRPLVHRGGLRADIVKSGTIAVGDRIAAREE